LTGRRIETKEENVQKIRMWMGLTLAVAAAALVGCGGGGKSSSVNVRVVNATLTHTSLSLLANSSTIGTATALDTVSGYSGITSGSPSLQVNDATTGTVLATTAPSLASDQHYVVIAYESGGTVRTAVIQEDTAAPSTGTAILRVLNAASDAGAVDVYVTDPATDISTLSSPTFSFTSPTASGFLSFAPGTYRLRVTGSGNTADLRLDILSFTLASQQIATAVLTPTIGGTLDNGSILTQQGVYTAARNTSARVRLAGAVTNGATVSAAAAAVSLGSNVVAPSVGAYVLVPAASTFNVLVNGATVAAPATTLAAGSDATLLVYGNAGSAVTSLVTDDNHLPATTTNLKIRLVNGLTGAAAPALTLDANFAIVASNIAPGAASSYSTVPVVTGSTTTLQVVSPNSLNPINSPTSIPLPGNAVYTLFMVGDKAAPITVLRKDR
jgi:Domain of unknown function (DUF4397)